MIGNNPKWPSPEEPYREDVRFVSREGERTVNGKVYCPTLLRLKLSEDEAWRVVQELLCQLQYGKAGEEIALNGQITELKEE